MRGSPAVQRCIETFGPLYPSASDFINEIGCRILSVTGDRRQSTFPFQCLSTYIQRCNLHVVTFNGALYIHSVKTRLDPPDNKITNIGPMQAATTFSE